MAVGWVVEPFTTRLRQADIVTLLPYLLIFPLSSMLKDAGVHTAPLGGDVPAIEISALKQTNLDTLVKTILSTAAKRNLKANPVKPATGYIIEAKSDKLRG